MDGAGGDDMVVLIDCDDTMITMLVVVQRLRFGKMVDKVIPYLPMDPASNLLVVELKLQQLAKTLDGGLYTTSGER